MPEKRNFTKSYIDSLAPKSKREIVYDAKTTGLGLRISPKGKKVFFSCGNLKVGSKWNPDKFTIGPYPDVSIEQARITAHEHSELRKQGISPKEAENKKHLIKSGEKTFGDAFADYRRSRRMFPDIEALKRAGNTDQQIQKKCYGESDRYWKLLSRWKDIPLSEINRATARAFIQELEDSAAFKKSTINKYHRCAKSIYLHAIKVMDCKVENPFDFPKINESDSASGKRLQSKNIQAFFKALEVLTPQVRDYVYVLLYTGRRQGEVLKMRWADVDLDTGVWRVPIGASKTKKQQDVVLAGAAIAILASRDKSSLWVFPSRENKDRHMVPPNRQWNKVRKEMNDPDLRIHDLRGTFSSFAQENNMPIALVKDQLGHKTLETTMKFYTHIDPEVQRVEIDKTIASMMGEPKGLLN